MNANEHISIRKDAELPLTQDYYRLRGEGIALIQQLGSRLWTDYNLHDPGITFLEALCYAITDLGYRSSFGVADLLAEFPNGDFVADDQAFFGARQILSTAPWTLNDYRKLLIDRDGVKNAWPVCSLCTCGPVIYIDCKNDRLTYTKPAPPENPKTHEVLPKGLYDVDIEFDRDERYGDLNSGKVSLTYSLLLDGASETLFLEVRFPSPGKFAGWEKENPHFSDLKHEDTALKAIRVKNISWRKDDTLPLSTEKLRSSLRGGLYVTMEADIRKAGSAQTHTLLLKNVPFRLVLLKDGVRKHLLNEHLEQIFEDLSDAGVLATYRNKLARAQHVLDLAQKTLHAHRNLTEDFCCVEAVEIEEMGICADIELTPEADIEQVLGEAYYLMGEYINPSVKFHTLAERLAEKPVDEIYDGPQLAHGFIDDADLEKSVLNRTLYASDIINLLMDIPGITAVKNFVLVRFDEEGNRKETHPWQLKVSPGRLPRLYTEGSKILLFKNGLPFLPDTPELMDTLHIVSGRNSRPKLRDYELDLPVPTGTPYALKEYFSVQHSLPQVYGVGEAGLPESAPPLRKAQASQLKAYLFFFEQLLADYLGQLDRLKNLFSINPVERTYYPVLLQNAQIKDIEDLYDSLDQLSLYEMTETRDAFLARRNRFLDHLLARFSESFSEYALLLYSSQTGKKTGAETLADIKSSFLKQYPYQSAYRAQAFDHTIHDNINLRKDLSGIQERVASLLGLKPSAGFFRYDIRLKSDRYTSELRLSGPDGMAFTALSDFSHENRHDTVRELNRVMTQLVRMAGDVTRYTVVSDAGKFTLNLGTPAVATQKDFGTQAAAEAARDAWVTFAQKELADERFLIIEHILLRPHAKTDALLQICVDPDCNFCGNEDPYSYRVTFVFDGESTRAKTDFEFRRFAERTIRSELPAHVLAKICWVKTGDYHAFETTYDQWLASGTEGERSSRLAALVTRFNGLKSIYPPPTLHDCVDGNDNNRVFLNQTQL